MWSQFPLGIKTCSITFAYLSLSFTPHTHKHTARIYTYTHTSTHIHTHPHTSTHIHTHPHTSTHIHTHPHTSTQTYKYTHTHTCIHTLIKIKWAQKLFLRDTKGRASFAIQKVERQREFATEWYLLIFVAVVAVVVVVVTAVVKRKLKFDRNFKWKREQNQKEITIFVRRDFVGE